jgi:UDP-N-acetyl-D-mannosaminuronic acid dehydrogenase
VNDGIPAQVVRRVERALVERFGESAPRPENREKHAIACLGLAYKADVDDCRESPAVEVVNLLHAGGFRVRAYDPYVRRPVVAGQVESLEDAIAEASVVVILTDHSPFRERADLLQSGGRFAVVDTRNALGASRRG